MGLPNCRDICGNDTFPSEQIIGLMYLVGTVFSWGRLYYRLDRITDTIDKIQNLSASTLPMHKRDEAEVKRNLSRYNVSLGKDLALIALGLFLYCFAYVQDKNNHYNQTICLIDCRNAYDIE